MTREFDDTYFTEIKLVTLKEYNFIQIYHINKHKWFLSQEQNKEINFNEAANDWLKSGLAIKFRKYFIIK